MPNCEDESAACKQDRKDYDSAATERDASEKRIYTFADEVKKAGADLVASAGTAAVGVAVAWGAGWTGIGVILGGVIAVGGVFAAGVSEHKLQAAKQKLADERAYCETWRQKMEDARQKAGTDCKDPDCVPPAPQPCP